MSQSVVLACPAACDLPCLSAVMDRTARNLSASFLGGDSDVQIVDADRSFYVVLSEVRDRDGVALEYESNEDLDAAFRREVLDLRFYSLDLNDFGTAQRVLFDLLLHLSKLGMNP
jgi:hypothetical protein